MSVRAALSVADRRVIIAVELLDRRDESVEDDVLARLLNIPPAELPALVRSLERRRLVYRTSHGVYATQAGVRAALDVEPEAENET